ncbi:non-ribosomal peptide synthetase [Anaerobacterium chartisolvens]|uniref:non-ribosomal peptide synthetase n=1 Tax=Anaerobacterium chartisolvens TaxID=1297424 RepID=UPI00147525E6|nr:non-ribosomal peptide synthetase [Anaerobacterium chartisolvens]
MNLNEKDILSMYSRLNDTDLEYDRDKTLAELFECQVRSTPDSIAVVFEDKTVTYSQLNIKANKLAWKLRDMGIGRGSLVAVILNRSIELFAAILGVLKSGAAYIPIDPDYPPERVRYMLSFSNAALVISSQNISEGTDLHGNVLNADDTALEGQKEINPPVLNGPEDLAYVIFTSGSTGKPKGVMIEQRAVNNFFAGITRLIDFNPSKKILGLTTVSFDIFVLETFLPLFTGARIILANERQQMDSKLLSSLIVTHRVDMLQITPSRLQMLMSHPKSREALSCVKEIMVGGEAFVKKLLPELQKFSSLRIFNMYGPTETTVWSTVMELTNREKITIGRPIANTQVYILNDRNIPAGIGEPGELCISGDGLARGYLNDREKTDESFIESPFKEGTRLYRTGDLARLLPDGDIEVIGRNDSQVKIRGYRIEIKEIEEALGKYEGITGCAVLALDDKMGYKYLAAYYTSNGELDKSGIREELHGVLPSYMVPSVFIRIDEFPMTPNGKLDRKALPSPEGFNNETSSDNTQKVSVDNEVQREILKVWMELLPAKSIGINDNFFDIGGNSMQLVIMSNMINEVYEDKVEVADIFANPTIKRLAGFIESKYQNNDEPLYEAPVIEFPDAFMQDSYEDSIKLCLNVDENKIRGFEEISLSYEITNEILFAAMFLFLISQITNQKAFSVASILTGENAIRNISLDFNGIEDLAEVLMQMKGITERYSGCLSYPVEQVRELGKGINNTPASVLVAVGGTQTKGLENVFDLIFQIDNKDGAPVFLLEYNASVFKQSKIKKILSNYQELIEMLVD